MRFEPGLGTLLAAAADNFVSIIDVDRKLCRFKLQVCSVLPIDSFEALLSAIHGSFHESKYIHDISIEY